MLLTAGFTPLDAVQTYATLARYVLGFGIQSGSGHDGILDPADPLTIEILGEEKLSSTERVRSVGPIPLTDEFHYGLELMVAGLRTLHPAP